MQWEKVVLHRETSTFSCVVPSWVDFPTMSCTIFPSQKPIRPFQHQLRQKFITKTLPIESSSSIGAGNEKVPPQKTTMALLIRSEPDFS